MSVFEHCDPVGFVSQEIDTDPELLEDITFGRFILPDGFPLQAFLEAINAKREKLGLEPYVLVLLPEKNLRE